MCKQIVENLDEEKLRTCINKLREVLNEIEPSLERLIVSQQLDKLIVEYMYLKKAPVE